MADGTRKSSHNGAPRTIIAIDLMRFGCAMLVLGYHLSTAYWIEPSAHGRILLAPWRGVASGTQLTRVGWIGVELFFVISGMVIAQSARDASWQDFLRRRALRLVPAAWVCATLSLAMLAASGAFGPALIVEWGRSMLFWPVGNAIDGSYWTLGVECFFYLLLAAVIGGGATARRIDNAGMVLGSISAGLWIACLFDARIQYVMADNAAMLLLLPHGVFFAIGIMLAGREGKAPDLKRGIVFAVLLAGAMVEIGPHALARFGGTPVHASAGLAQLIFAAGLAVLATAPRLQASLARWITPGQARMIGLMTYPLYLIHQDAGAVLIGAMMRAGVAVGPAQFATAMAMVMLAWCIARYAEPWLRTRLSAIFNRYRDRAPGNRPTAFPSGG